MIYEVEYQGRKLTISQYSAITGICQDTLRKRARSGQPISLPTDAAWTGRRREKPEEMKRQEKHGFENGYTREEIEELYGHFAGAENELRILMDFTGLGYLYAEKLLEELKEERRKTS